MTALKKTDNVLAFFDKRIELPRKNCLVSAKEYALIMGISYNAARQSLAYAGIRPIHTPGVSAVRYQWKEIMDALGL